MLVLLTLVFAFQININAEEMGRPLISIEATEPDENGVFDLVVSLEKGHFIVYELAIKFDGTAVTPVNNKGEATDSFGAFGEENRIEGVSYVGCKLDMENCLFLFTGYVVPGAKGDIFRNKMIYLEDKTELYRFSFKVKESGKDFGFDIASAFNGELYDPFFPDGAVLLSGLAEEKRYVSDVVIRYGDKVKTFETPYYTYNELYPKNFTKEQRLAGTVYLVENDYAAAVDGVLFAVDPANKRVVPFKQDGEMYLPLRFVCESLGYTVGWDEATETVIITDAVGEVKTVDTKSSEGVELVNDRTMVTSGLLQSIIKARVYEANNEAVVYTGIPEWTPDRQAEKEAIEAMRYVLMPFFRMFV